MEPRLGEEDRDLMVERMFAVAIRDGKDLFLWIRIRRAERGDIYYMIPTGRQGPEWERWNLHGSQHRDGHFHTKSYDRKIFPQKRQKPDSNFRGTEQMVTRPIACHEPRAFGVICNPAEFSEVMEVPASILSPKTYETYISVDLTEPGGQILAQRAFNESVPWILVTVFESRAHNE